MPFNPDNPLETGYNPWETTEGLPDDFDGVIEQVEFLYDPRYNNGQTLLASFDIRRFDDEPNVEQRYTLGPGWSPKGNRVVVHERGPRQKFNKRTQYGELVDRMARLLPSEVLATRDPHEAEAFEGLSFHWQREAREYEFTRDGQTIKGTKSTLWPSQYLPPQAQLNFAAAGTGTARAGGPGGGASNGAQGVQGAQVGTEAVMATLSGGGTNISLPQGLADQVAHLAVTRDYTSWGTAVLSLPGATRYDDLMRAISNEAFYRDLHNAPVQVA